MSHPQEKKSGADGNEGIHQKRRDDPDTQNPEDRFRATRSLDQHGEILFQKQDGTVAERRNQKQQKEPFEMQPPQHKTVPDGAEKPLVLQDGKWENEDGKTLNSDGQKKIQITGGFQENLEEFK